MRAATAMGSILFGLGLLAFAMPAAAQQNNCDPRLFGRWKEISADSSTFLTYTFNADGPIQSTHSWERVFDSNTSATVRDSIESLKPIAYKCIRRDAFTLYWKNGEKCLVLIEFLPGMMASTEWKHEGDMIRGGGHDCGKIKYIQSIMFQRTN